jgi:hypothetical protein
MPDLIRYRPNRTEIGKEHHLVYILTYNVQLTLDGLSGFHQTSVGATVSSPLADKCTVVLLQGSFRLDDENEITTDTFMAFDIEGSKTLTTGPKSTVVWFPSVCCWKSSECTFARKGECRRIPGVVIPRDPKNPMWWEKDDVRKSKKCVLM